MWLRVPVEGGHGDCVEKEGQGVVLYMKQKAEAFGYWIIESYKLQEEVWIPWRLTAVRVWYDSRATGLVRRSTWLEFPSETDSPIIRKARRAYGLSLRLCRIYYWNNPNKYNEKYLRPNENKLGQTHIETFMRFVLVICLFIFALSTFSQGYPYGSRMVTGNYED